MLFASLFHSPLQFLIIAVAILIGFTIHEYTHALVADKLGDSTPRLMGRLTLNPLAHLDLVGTIFLLLAGFGWGKPVMVNARNFKNPILDNVTVSLAGPISNFVLAVILGLGLRFIQMPDFLAQILTIIIFFNLVLMIFNFLPIPPLDGSKLLSLILPQETYLQFEQFGTFILFGFIILSNFIPIIPFIMSRVVNFFFALITGQQLA